MGKSTVKDHGGRGCTMCNQQLDNLSDLRLVEPAALDLNFWGQPPSQLQFGYASPEWRITGVRDYEACHSRNAGFSVSDGEGTGLVDELQHGIGSWSIIILLSEILRVLNWHNGLRSIETPAEGLRRPGSARR
jgi:hypothetical protein